MSARRAASRKKARSAPATDEPPAHSLDTLFRADALPKHVAALADAERYLAVSANTAAEARSATKILFDYGLFLLVSTSS